VIKYPEITKNTRTPRLARASNQRIWLGADTTPALKAECARITRPMDKARKPSSDGMRTEYPFMISCGCMGEAIVCCRLRLCRLSLSELLVTFVPGIAVYNQSCSVWFRSFVPSAGATNGRSVASG